MIPFDQNFAEDINANGKLCPGNYEFGKLIRVMNERPRFGGVVNIVNKIMAFMSRNAVSELFTHHYFIHSNSFNDGLAAATAIYYAIVDKYDYCIEDSIVNRSDPRNYPRYEGPVALYMNSQLVIPDGDTPSLFIFHKTKRSFLEDFDRCGIKIGFIIYSEDIAAEESDFGFIGMDDEATVNKTSGPRQIAAELHYTYVDIPSDSNQTLAGYISDFFVRNGFLTANVKKQIKQLASLDCVKDEYTAVAAAKNVLNRHIQNLNEMPRLMSADFFEYVGSSAPTVKANNIEKVSKNRIVGLEREKKELNDAVNGLLLNMKRKKTGAANVPMGCNLVFAGSPGTAKTTLARMFAKSLAANKLIPSEENFKECRKSDIIGKYVGFTASMIDQMFSEMHNKGGGVIFFDEIYSLSEQDSTSYDKEAINCITQNIENYRTSVYCIFAGYKNKMKGFINANPGLSSRISATIVFDDYSNETLCEIFDSIASSEEFVISGNYSKHLTKFFEKLREARGDNFGNGREARNLFEGAKRIMASRVISANESTKAALSTIKSEEVKAAADTILASVIEDREPQMQTIGF